MFRLTHLCCAAFAALLAAITAGPARAELAANRIANGEFDSSLDGWDEIFPEISSFLPQPTQDADECLTSGGAEAGNSNPEDHGSTFFRTCTSEVTAGEILDLQARFWYFVGAAEARAQFSVAAYSNSDCTGDSLGSMITPFASVADGTNVWHRRRLYVPLTVPEETQSIEVQLTFTKIDGDDNVSYVHFDRVHLTSADWIHSEDFELGELCRWSVVGP